MSVLDFLCCCRRQGSKKPKHTGKNSKQLLLDKFFAVSDQNYEYLRKEKDYFNGPVKGGYGLLAGGYLAAIATRTPSLACYGACGAIALFSVGPIMKTIEKRREIAEAEEKRLTQRRSNKI